MIKILNLLKLTYQIDNNLYTKLFNHQVQSLIIFLINCVEVLFVYKNIFE
jgi:hypothetical protein